MPDTRSDPRTAPYRKTEIWPAEVEVETRADGAMLVRCPRQLGPYPQTITQRLVHWAQTRPDHTFIARRDGGGDWQRVSYGQALRTVQRIGAGLLARGLSPDRPVVILSENDIEHQLLGLAAMYVGVPFAPISPAYALVSSDLAKLRHIICLLTPGLVFASSGHRYRRAIETVVPDGVEVVTTIEQPGGRQRATSFADLAAGGPEAAVIADAAHARVGPDTIAKVLFTSGSTGRPKGVINTQRMLCSNAEISAATIFGSLRQTPPVIVDWLPWNHTFGGNANVGLVLYFGGTLYVDDGRPIPGQFEETVRNLREIAPTVYFNVPKGYEYLVQYLRQEPQLRKTFFSRLGMTFFAGASLAQHVWDALDELSVETIGERIVMMSGLGATETGPSAMFCTMDTLRSGSIGLPVPGCTLKLVPRDGKLEARVAGPSITPGYWREPDLTAAAFDEEGFYCFNDAIRFVDAADPKKGFLFDGRITEDFKLASGTWVSVGPLRARFIAAFAPYARDVVITGLNRDALGAIMIPDVEACRQAWPELGPAARHSDIAGSPALRAELARRLAAMARSSTGSSTRIARLAVLDEPPSIDAGEITDKGSINQRAVLDHRAALVEAMHAQAPDLPVIVLEG